MNDIRINDSRGTKDVLGALGDFGGLLGVLQSVCLIFLAGFADKKMLGIIANRFFTETYEPLKNKDKKHGP